jgi:hypothetical protein
LADDLGGNCVLQLSKRMLGGFYLTAVIIHGHFP